jgi:hypothetical protein
MNLYAASIVIYRYRIWAVAIILGTGFPCDFLFIKIYHSDAMVNIPPEGIKVHLKGYGFIKVFRFVSKDGDTQYWSTDVLNMQEEEKRISKESLEN